MEALLERQKPGADAGAFAAAQAGVSARKLQRTFPRFSARVGEKDSIQSGAFGETQSQLRLSLVIVEIRGVDERTALAGNRLNDCRMVVAEGVDANAAEQIEVLRTVLVLDVDPFTVHEQNRAPIVRGKQQTGLRGANLFEFHRTTTS